MDEFQHALPKGYRFENRRYEILGVLGSEGVFINYQARDLDLEKDVAIREFFFRPMVERREDRMIPVPPVDQDFIDWAIHEIWAEGKQMAAARSPFLPRIHNSFNENGTVYIVQELIEGENLSEFIRRRGKLGPAEFRALFMSMLDGLEALHGTDRLHGDIRPTNIIIRKKDKTPVLVNIDWAQLTILRLAQEKGLYSGITKVLGPKYTALEMYHATAPKGVHIDIYSLAGVACSLLYGSPPFATERVIDDPLAGWTEKVEGYDRGFLQAINAGLAIHAKDRPSSVAEWRRMFEAAERGEVIPPASHQEGESGAVAPPPASPEPSWWKALFARLGFGKS
ncbi:MAG: protein kinase [Sphingomonadales bacterium]